MSPSYSISLASGHVTQPCTCLDVCMLYIHVYIEVDYFTVALLPDVASDMLDSCHLKDSTSLLLVWPCAALVKQLTLGQTGLACKGTLERRKAYFSRTKPTFVCSFTCSCVRDACSYVDQPRIIIS